jgi:hypothetical protein|tara:strand:- start:154 stop:612 length:459 start_codon:yes stop_codon:yes gene_type:complete
MGQAQVDEWCADLANAHYMEVSDTHYAAVPREVRGVPHVTVPGVHAYLTDYADAMERARTLLDIEDRRTVDSLQCITLGPFAERQPPHISESSGARRPRPRDARARARRAPAPAQTRPFQRDFAIRTTPSAARAAPSRLTRRARTWPSCASL